MLVDLATANSKQVGNMMSDDIYSNKNFGGKKWNVKWCASGRAAFHFFPEKVSKEEEEEEEEDEEDDHSPVAALLNTTLWPSYDR